MDPRLATREDAAAPLPSLGRELELLRLVWGVVHGLERTSKRMERTLGVTGPQRFVIRVVGRFPGLTLARVATLLQVHPSTASGIVKRLERAGLVQRRSDTRDRRRAYLGLTEAGRRVDMHTAGTIEAAVERTLAATSPDDIDGARATLEALARELMVDGTEGHGRV